MRLFPVFLLVLWAATTASVAQAALRFCNETAGQVSVAIGYFDGEDWTSEGWWTMAAGECKTALSGDLETRFYFWHATDDDGILVEGEYPFCLSRKVFTIVGDTDCAARGFEEALFDRVDTAEERSFTVTLRAEDDASGSAAASGDGTGAEAVVAALQGRWQDVGDPAFETQITDRRFADAFGGVPAATGRFEVAATCDGARDSGPVLMVTYEDPSDGPFCWEILELDQQVWRFRAVGQTAIVSMVKQ